MYIAGHYFISFIIFIIIYRIVAIMMNIKLNWKKTNERWCL